MSTTDIASEHRPRRRFWRFLILAHRYIGIAISLIVLLWCFSGIVMMYVQYPAMDSAERLQGLSSFSLPVENRDESSPPQTSALIGDFVIEASPLGLILRAQFNNGRYRTLNLESGDWIESWSEESLAAAARQYALNRSW